MQGTALISRKDARIAGLTRYFTGKPCKWGHICERLVSISKCVDCNRINVKLCQALGGSQHARHQAGHKRCMKLRWARAATPAVQNYLMGRDLRKRFRKAVAGCGVKVGSAVRDLGCTLSSFREHIAAKFTDGMSWNNYGEWHFDHIRPLASFDLKDRDQFLIAAHFTNYQPLWAADNIAKGASWCKAA